LFTVSALKYFVNTLFPFLYSRVLVVVVKYALGCERQMNK
jgi:hypothetical protein